jgi:hypothetical protein
MTRQLAVVALGLALIASLAAPRPGSAAILGYFAGDMNGAIEVSPNNSAGTGSAHVTYDDVAHTMRVEAVFSGLTGTTSAAHIHAPTVDPFTGGAGVATQTPSFSGFPLGVTAGSMDTTFDLTLASSWNSAYITANGGTPATAEAAFFNAMNTGRAYFNIHSSAFGAGEIRSFFVVPEPGALTLFAAAAGVLAIVRRRRAS